MGDIEVFKTVVSLQKRLYSDGNKRNIGFVPTMGALHEGHMTLVRKSLNMADFTVVSIFVNPTQFNNPTDLEKYPRNLENDIELLKKQGDIIIFAPSVDEVYSEDYQSVRLELGAMGNVMEGKFREGHFDGVVNVVKRLFEIVQPNYAFFGLKDFQQLAIVQYMTKHFNMEVEIVSCEIYREKSGLASSSRNERLTEDQKQKSLVIYESLLEAKKSSSSKSIHKVIEQVLKRFQESDLVLEYFQIVDPKTLMDLDTWESGARACITAYCGEVRLLDNLQLIKD